MTAKEIVDKFKTANIEGFTPEEIDKILEDNNLDKSKFYENLGIHTAAIKNGISITYHSDVELAIRCIIENRKPTIYEWD